VIKKKEKLGRACNTYDREERCILGVGEESWRKETTWKPQD